MQVDTDFYEFDVENRLSQVDNGTTITTYLYDGSGEMVRRKVSNGTQGQEAKEITGTVLGVEGKTLWIEGDQGAAIPVRVTHQTELDGQKLKKDQRIESHLKKQFQPGEEVRASFKLDKKHLGKEENAAVSIEKQQK